MNAQEERTQAVKVVKDAESSPTSHEVDISGAWRIWPEHGGEPETQGVPRNWPLLSTRATGLKLWVFRG